MPLLFEVGLTVAIEPFLFIHTKVMYPDLLVFGLDPLVQESA